MKKLLAMAEISIFTLFALCMPAHTANLDAITGNMVLETSAQADMYEEASDESKIVASLEAGTVVFITENAEDNWCKISAGEHTGYIKVEYLKTIGDQGLINQEFEQNMNDNHKIYDEIQQLEEQKSRAEIRENLMLGLIIVVLAAGVVLKGRKARKAHNDKSNPVI